MNIFKDCKLILKHIKMKRACLTFTPKGMTNSEFHVTFKKTNNYRHMKYITLILIVFISIQCTTTKNNIQSDYQLVWSDEFNEKEVNLNNWSFEIWDAGRVNNEWQAYIENKDNYKLENASLYITAVKTGNNEKGGYTSTRLSSQGKREFQYGRIEFRAKMPIGRGTWPALWMLGYNIDEVGWPKCGEIDVMEYVGFEPDKTHTNVHTQYQHGMTDFHVVTENTTAEEAFHTYGIIWTKDAIQFYLDSPENITNTYSPKEKTIDNWPLDRPYFLIMNFAVGGDWGGANGVDDSVYPQSMIVDYVRVYQLK